MSLADVSVLIEVFLGPPLSALRDDHAQSLGGLAPGAVGVVERRVVVPFPEGT